MDKTLIIFCADNGLSLGEHGLLGKQNVYENGGMCVPLVFAGPGIRHGESDAFAYLFDIFPTVCDLVGIRAASQLDGKSFVAIARRESGPRGRSASGTNSSWPTRIFSGRS